MIRVTSKPLLLFFILLLQLPVSLLGQERGLYQGDYKVGPYLGKADFQFVVSNRDTIFDGPFQMQRSSLEALLEKEDSSFLFSGGFNNGLASGPWKLEFGDYQSDNQSKVVGFEYRVFISGIQEEAKGILNKGIPDGKWVYQVNRIKESEIDTILFKSEFSFEDGVPQQNFKIENDSTVLVGRFLRNGLAHDEWSSYSFENIADTENWYFEEGLLTRIQIIKDGVAQILPVFDVKATDYRLINLDRNYLELVQAVVHTQGYTIVPKNGITRLLAQNETYYQKIDGILRQLGSSHFEANYSVNVPFYEIDSVQKKTLAGIVSDYGRAREISTKLLENSHLNIIKRSDEDALYNYNVAAKISEEFLQPIAVLAAYDTNGIVEYLNLSQVLPQLWPGVKPSKEITVTEGLTSSKTFSLENAEEFNFDGATLNSVSQIATYARLSLETIENTLSDRLTNEERMQELNGLEEDLIALNNSVIQKVDSLESLPAKYGKALERIKSLSDSSLQNYATIEKPKEKLEFGNRLKRCLEELTALIVTIGELPEQKESMDLLYQDSIWNPFMATVMDEEVKKRITTAYSKILLPYFLESITTAIDCDNAGEWNQQIIQTNQRMEVLREEDTRKLERKLKRQKNPEEIMRLFFATGTEKED